MKTSWILVAALTATSCDPGPSPKKLPMYGDDGQTIRVNVGDEFGLAAADNPTWSPTSRTELGRGIPSCVSVVSSTFESSDAGNRAPGGGAGTRIWILKAVQPGEGKLLLTTRAGGQDRVLTVIVSAGTTR